MSSLEGLN